VPGVYSQAPEIDATTPEGALLQRIGMAQNEDEKIRDMDEFLSKYPQHGGVPWVLAQQIAVFESRKDPAKVMGAAEKLLTVDPASVRGAFSGLRAAESAGDDSKVVAFAEATHAACTKALSTNMPAEADEDQWKAAQDYAKQIQPLSEYAFATLAGKASDAAVIDGHAERLAKLNPESEYLAAIWERQFLVARAAANQPMGLKAAEALAGKGKANEDVLLYLAGIYLESKRHPEKVVEYTDSALKSLAEAKKPETIAEVDWDKTLKFNTGLAHWIQGLHHANAQRWAPANKALRAALPLVQGNASMLAAAYFFLGIANFEIGKRSKDHKEVIDAVKFSEQCAAIASPYQAQARQNVKAMRAQFRF
jgi:hypothetical protein